MCFVQGTLESFEYYGLKNALYEGTVLVACLKIHILGNNQLSKP